jgi:hypothetical protein
VARARRASGLFPYGMMGTREERSFSRASLSLAGQRGQAEFVEPLAREPADMGVAPWLDIWEIKPGLGGPALWEPHQRAGNRPCLVLGEPAGLRPGCRVARWIMSYRKGSRE